MVQGWTKVRQVCADMMGAFFHPELPSWQDSLKMQIIGPHVSYLDPTFLENENCTNR